MAGQTWKDSYLRGPGLVAVLHIGAGACGEGGILPVREHPAVDLPVHGLRPQRSCQQIHWTLALHHGEGDREVTPMFQPTKGCQDVHMGVHDASVPAIHGEMTYTCGFDITTVSHEDMASIRHTGPLPFRRQNNSTES